MTRSALITTLEQRGYIHQCTDLARLDEAASQGVVTGYIGFDMTAPSLHVGSLVQIMLLRRLQQAGGKPIVLLGGGTTKVGDPTGRDESRKMLSDADIAHNMASIRGVFEKFLKFGDGPTDAIIVNNDDWLSRYGYVEFLREYGTHFTINRMLSFDSVKLRLEREQPMTFLEFNYMLMQAVDYLELSRRFKCSLQMGGSDQWGNIVNGVELCRRVDSADAFGLTTPLLATASGAKMGKTAAGAVWLNADMLSAYAYWQYWRNAEDADVGRFMKLFTDLPLTEIDRYAALQGAAINDAKKALANAATAMLHGEAAAKAAEATAQATFDGGGAGDALPTVEAPRAEIAGLRVADALRRAGLVDSNGEAKRHIKAGAVSVNNRAVSDDLAVLAESDIDGDGVVKLSVGKKRHALLRVSRGGKFELYKDRAGEFRFRLKASNGQTLLASEGYKTKAGALAAIESVKANAATPARYTKKAQTSGKPFFVLTATNGQIIAQSEAYDTETARDNGIDSVQVAANAASTDDAAA